MWWGKKRKAYIYPIYIIVFIPFWFRCYFVLNPTTDVSVVDIFLIGIRSFWYFCVGVLTKSWVSGRFFLCISSFFSLFLSFIWLPKISTWLETPKRIIFRYNLFNMSLLKKYTTCKFVSIKFILKSTLCIWEILSFIHSGLFANHLIYNQLPKLIFAKVIRCFF